MNAKLSNACAQKIAAAAAYYVTNRRMSIGQSFAGARVCAGIKGNIPVGSLR